MFRRRPRAMVMGAPMIRRRRGFGLRMLPLLVALGLIIFLLFKALI